MCRGWGALVAVLVGLVAASPAAAEMHVTNSADSGSGSLREVVATAPPEETVVIDAAVNPMLAAPVTVNQSLTIRGRGAAATTISGGGVTRVFVIGPAAEVRIEALRISGGRAPQGANGQPEIVPSQPPTNGQQGGDGGAILNAGDLAVVGVSLDDNAAGAGGNGGAATVGPGTVGGDGGDGGAIANLGTLAIVDSTLGDNAAGAGGSGGSSSFFAPIAGAAGNGGAVFNTGTMTVVGSTFAGNEAADGLPGGFSPAAVGGNGSRGGHGGAVYTVAGVARFTNSTFVGNSAGSGGDGGTSFTIPGTGGDGGDGGAIAATGGTVTVAAATVLGNSAGSAGAGGTGNPPAPSGPPGAAGLGGGVAGLASVTIRASILASNVGGGAPNCSAGVLDDGGGNLAFPTAGGCLSFPVGDPRLDPAGLADNGGLTQTVALLPGSAALDAVPAASCVAADGEPLKFDQRGVARPQEGACDVGAFERMVGKPPPPPPPPPQSPGSPGATPKPTVETTLMKKPKKVVKTRKKRARVVIRFSSTPAGASFECRLDKAAFKPCKSPQSYRLKAGRHRIAVRAVLDGVADPSPAEVAFRVVRVKPKSR